MVMDPELPKFLKDPQAIDDIIGTRSNSVFNRKQKFESRETNKISDIPGATRKTQMRNRNLGVYEIRDNEI